MVIATVCLFAQCSSPERHLSQGNIDVCMDFTGEDTLTLTNHVTDTTTGQQEIISFDQNISTSVQADLPLLIDSIYANAFCSLKDSAERHHDKISGCGNYFTAMKVSYGLNVQYKKITVLYQPVYLCKTTGQNYAVKNTGAYYEYNAGSLSFVISTDTSSFKRYTDSILISHTVSATPSHFRNPPADNDTLGDVRSVIFPFQEIAALIADNETQYVKIWNAIRPVPVISAGVTLNKHDLILGPAQLHIPLSPVDTTCGGALFCNKFANLGSLCPPNCLSVSQ
jgi:hypothetical protein